MQNTQLTTSHPSKPKRFVIVSLAATAMVLGSQLPASARNPLQSSTSISGLIAYYKMNEGSGNVARNKVANDKHLQIVGADWSRGKFGKGLQFSGTDGLPPGASDYARADGPFDFGSNEATIATWFRYNEMDGHWHPVISAPECCSYRVLVYPDGHLYIDAGQHYDWYVQEIVLQPAKWYHIALTMRGGEAARLYVNGSLIATNSQAVPFQLPNPSAFVLGTGEWDSGFYYGLNGKLDETRIYNKVLNQNEVRAAMRPGVRGETDGSDDRED